MTFDNLAVQNKVVLLKNSDSCWRNVLGTQTTTPRSLGPVYHTHRMSCWTHSGKLWRLLPIDVAMFDSRIAAENESPGHRVTMAGAG